MRRRKAGTRCRSMGSCARSAAITGAAPRKYANGDSAISWYLSANQLPARGRASIARQARGPAICRALGSRARAAWRPICLRRAWPSARRSSGVAQCILRNIHRPRCWRNGNAPRDLHFSSKPFLFPPRRRSHSRAALRISLLEELSLTRAAAHSYCRRCLFLVAASSLRAPQAAGRSR